MVDDLSIEESVYDEIVLHAKALKPVESCGYLAGKEGHIQQLYKMTNLDNEPDHFTFDPKEQFAVLKASRAAGTQLLAVYHSHPVSPARPSIEDLRLLKDPSMIYVIVSLEKDQADLKAFRIVEMVVTELNVTIKKGN